ncbi:Pseudouridine-5'-phosphate glycosidase [Pseudovibrio sp. Ad46]|uniref:pseudouridine-5'-phosphate glycosidase n=1 Tax=unclassified Pseudovibrio TaxID=2627060 RepID=UPI0007AE4962|nr:MULTISPECIES: pseudouridine-5'-phosphate glycosidase [unclassified Pseudovibrio]KZK77639.1 Pseudouridine-5'-phosphate glycosidase [Pseudovibrio sp. Ad46]KZK93510.1 Pseudouridine-5'-phosphate glycosidase [Pseudovibrio sp. Ad5]
MGSSIKIHHSKEVADALSNGAPIVALESTIITHGMPYPQNVETAREVEQIIRDGGAVPATIAVLNGELHVGLEDSTLEELANAKDVMKCSRADLSFAMALGKNGSTTVAATMMAAHAAGIRVFATGGIGGVHKGAETSFDISADLDELSRTPVCVVSAGAKALLDIPKTLEVLETRGVPVIGFSCENVPAFWSRDSKIKAPYSLDDASDISKLIKFRETFGDHGGMLVTNPVPVEDEIPSDEMQVFIDASIQAAEEQNITGKEVTPFVLQDIFERTNGRSLATNIALVKNNAKLATKIACGLTA